MPRSPFHVDWDPENEVLRIRFQEHRATELAVPFECNGAQVYAVFCESTNDLLGFEVTDGAEAFFRELLHDACNKGRLILSDWQRRNADAT